MSRKGENIYKRKDGRWEGRYKTDTGVNGRTQYKSCYGKTYREQFTAKGVAKILGIDPIYLSLCFKESMGKTFTEYVMEFRLDRAMDALLNKQISIEDAAKAGGFPSARTFIAKCKKVYHITPFQMLKQRAEVKSNV